eukprot:7878107-Pyramimonas_sp.AAC.1
MMEHREHVWGRWWTPDSVRRSLLEDSLGELRASTQLAVMGAPGLEVRDLVQACHCFSATTAIGVDQ